MERNPVAVSEAASPEEVRRIIRLVESDPAVRLELRRALLTSELIELPERFAEFATAAIGYFGRLESDVSVLESDVSVLKSDVSVLKSDVAVLKSDVAVLKSDVAEVKMRVGRLEARFGASIEAEAEDALLRALSRLGLVPTSTAFNVAMGAKGELDVAMTAENADGSLRVSVVAEAKARVSSTDVRKFGDRMRSSGFQRALGEAGMSGPWLAYIFGERVDRNCEEVARSLRLGLLKYTSDDPVLDAEMIEAAG
ncbi:MAG: hypothetical protein M0035_14180 [Actinomycetota bacterium]|nr:hypothetical protein [Actinomycetota bacterium]